MHVLVNVRCGGHGRLQSAFLHWKILAQRQFHGPASSRRPLEQESLTHAVCMWELTIRLSSVRACMAGTRSHNHGRNRTLLALRRGLFHRTDLTHTQLSAAVVAAVGRTPPSVAVAVVGAAVGVVRGTSAGALDRRRRSVNRNRRAARKHAQPGDLSAVEYSRGTLELSRLELDRRTLL